MPELPKFNVGLDNNGHPVRHTMDFATTCDKWQGHTHTVDHFMVVSRGRILVTCHELLEDGTKKPHGEPVEMTPSSVPLLIPAKLHHCYTALEPSLLHCLFPNGEQQTFNLTPGGTGNGS